MSATMELLEQRSDSAEDIARDMEALAGLGGGAVLLAMGAGELSVETIAGLDGEDDTEQDDGATEEGVDDTVPLYAPGKRKGKFNSAF